MEWHSRAVQFCKQNWSTTQSAWILPATPPLFCPSHLLRKYQSLPIYTLVNLLRILSSRTHTPSREHHRHGLKSSHNSRHHKSNQQHHTPPHKTNLQPQLHLLTRNINDQHSSSFPQRSNTPKVILATHDHSDTDQMPWEQHSTTTFTFVWSIWTRRLWCTSKWCSWYQWCSGRSASFPYHLLRAKTTLCTFGFQHSAGLQFYRLRYCSPLLCFSPQHQYLWPHIPGFYNGACGFSVSVAWCWRSWFQ